MLQKNVITEDLQDALSCTNSSNQQEVSSVCFRKQGISVPSTQSEHSPSGVYSFGAHCCRLPPSSGDIGNPIPRPLASPPSRPALAGPIFSYFRNSHPAFPGELYDIYICLYIGAGRPQRGFPDFGYLDPQAPYQLSGTQSGYFGLTPHWFSVPGPPCYDRYGHYNSSFLYQQTGRDPFSLPFTSGSRSLDLASSSGHTSQTQANTRLFECDRRPLISTLSANNDRVESPSQGRNLNLRDLGSSNSRHVCHSPQHSSSPVYVSDSRAASTGDRCSVSLLAGVVIVHVSTVPLAQQSHSETVPPRERGNSNGPQVAISAVVPKPTLTVCG